MIESLDNQKIKLINKLKQKKYRWVERQYYVEGEHLVQMALNYHKANYLLLSDAYIVEQNKLYKGTQFIAEINCPYDYISLAVLKKIKDTKTSQGIFAICDWEETQYDGASIVIFDGLQDPGNVGTIIRTAKAFGVHNFYFTGDTVDPYNEKVMRASQGAVLISNLFYEKTAKNILSEISALLQIYVLDLSGKSINSLQHKKQQPFAIIVGNEGNGINYQRWESFTLSQVTIPMNSEIESLNVAIATGIVLYKLFS